MKNSKIVFSREIFSLLLIVSFTCVHGGFELSAGAPHFDTKPYFLGGTPGNVTAIAGQSAYLRCRIAQLGDKKVSWIRNRDLGVLTSGVQTFASDDRFLSIHQQRSENWTLHIRFSQIRDSGMYQCQVNSVPKKSRTFLLNVIEGATQISGSTRQRYVKGGSVLRLLCSTSAPSESPGLVYWYQDSDILRNGPGVIINTTFLDEGITSELVILRVTEEHSGNFTCWPTKFPADSVLVHVVPDEKPAAISHGTASSDGVGGVGVTRVSNLHTLLESKPFVFWIIIIHGVLTLLPQR